MPSIEKIITLDVEELQRKLRQMAYAEAEIDLGVNPSDEEQAEIYKLGKKDFGYVAKADALAREKLNNPDWVKRATEKINKEINRESSGIKFNDELYHSGRGILESYNKEKYKKETWKNIAFWKEEIEKAGIKDKLRFFNDVVVDKKPPYPGTSYGEPVLTDIVLSGHKCDIYHSDHSEKDPWHKVFIHIKTLAT
jgi:hypothetical protein